MNEIDKNAKIIWDYMLMHHDPKKADAILVFGSHDTRPAEKAAELFLAGWAPIIVFSGGFSSRSTTGHFDRPEAEVFADVAIRAGVPPENILKETEATNSEQNVSLCKKLLEEKGLPTNRFIVVQKPYMERRAYATFKNFWPEPEIIMASQNVSFEEYGVDDEHKNKFIGGMVGDLQRIKEYPARGFQIEQEIPDEVWRAYENLVALGYTQHLIKEV